jgi:3',5'-cyclic AMP phosphodiesterase CpdA
MTRRGNSWDEGEYAIAHLSDLHFGSSFYREVWSLTAQHLLDIEPDLLLVTGDLVDSPRKKLYEEVKESLDSLRIPYYVCAGNHDSYFHGLQFPRWSRWLVRAALLGLAVGAGLTLSLIPNLALLAVSVAVAVAAIGWMSTDRLLWLTTRVLVDDHFAEVFQNKILTHEELRLLTVPAPSSESGALSFNPWTIGLFGDDSNATTDALARGYVPPKHFLPIRRATEGKDCELCLFLVHHHLLSIRRLEENRRNRAGSLLETTNMINAGSLLETLASAHVDLVLHGHEHEYNFASYGSVASGAQSVRVIAAGSATGNATLCGCIKQRATFNLLVLGADRSVIVRRYWLDAEQWRCEDVDRIDAASLRLNRIRRRLGISGDLISEVTKYVEFTRSRDLWVTWVYTYWLVPTNEFSQEIVNSTGRPEKKAQLRIGIPPSAPLDLEARIDRVAHKPNTWLIRADIPESFSGVPVQLELIYCWRGGGILTEEEMKQSAEFRQESGEPRSRGYEFVTGWTTASRPVAVLNVIVALPQEYAPLAVGTDRDVEVFVEHLGRRILHQENELRPWLRSHSQGLYSLSVAYPQGEHDYQIAWKPVPQPMVNERTHNDARLRDFVNYARLHGDRLLAIFLEQLTKSGFPKSSSLALYVADQNGEPNLVRLAYTGGNGESRPTCDGTPPALIPLMGSQHMLTRAWWGEPFGMGRRADPVEAHRVGFVAGEVVVVGVPIRLGLRATNPPPWGVVRIGVDESNSEQDLRILHDEEKLSTILLTAAIVLLSATLRVD